MKREDLVLQFFNNSRTIQSSWKAYYARTMSGDDLSPAQLALLFIIKHQQPVSGKKLAESMRVSKSAVTQLLESLDQHGYITRTEDSDDRRISHITLSETGSSKMNAFEQKRKEVFVSLASELSDEELMTILNVQKKMLEHLSSTNTK